MSRSTQPLTVTTSAVPTTTTTSTPSYAVSQPSTRQPLVLTTTARPTYTHHLTVTTTAVPQYTFRPAAQMIQQPSPLPLPPLPPPPPLPLQQQYPPYPQHQQQPTHLKLPSSICEVPTAVAVSSLYPEDYSSSSATPPDYRYLPAQVILLHAPDPPEMHR